MQVERPLARQSAIAPLGQVPVIGQVFVIDVLGFFATLPLRVADAASSRVVGRSPTYEDKKAWAFLEPIKPSKKMTLLR